MCSAAGQANLGGCRVLPGIKPCVGRAGRKQWLSGASLERAAASFMPVCLCEQSPVRAWGNQEESGQLGIASVGSLSVWCHVGAWADLAGTGVLLPQAEWSMGTGHRAGPAEEDLQGGSFQLPTGTKPALKGSAAEDSCPRQAVASEQPGIMWERKQGQCRGAMTCPPISSGCQLHPMWCRAGVLTPTKQTGACGCYGSVQGDVARLKSCAVSQGKKSREQAGWRQQPLQDTSLLPCCRHCLSMTHA